MAAQKSIIQSYTINNKHSLLPLLISDLTVGIQGSPTGRNVGNHNGQIHKFKTELNKNE